MRPETLGNQGVLPDRAFAVMRRRSPVHPPGRWVKADVRPSYPCEYGGRVDGFIGRRPLPSWQARRDRKGAAGWQARARLMRSRRSGTAKPGCGGARMTSCRLRPKRRPLSSSSPRACNRARNRGRKRPGGAGRGDRAARHCRAGASGSGGSRGVDYKLLKLRICQRTSPSPALRRRFTCRCRIERWRRHCRAACARRRARRRRGRRRG